MSWRVFPCHSIVNGACSCGKAKCGSPGKHPRTRAGFKEATDDEAQIRKWWTRWPNANIALATGGGIAVYDIDGAEGFAEFQAFVAQHGRVPETLTSQTGRGVHLVFATRDGAPSVRSAARGKVHVRGEGGYIILPPSNHISGRNYKWIKQVPLAILPDSLRQWGQGFEIANKIGGQGFDHLGHVPAYLSGSSKDINAQATEALKTVWSASEQARLISALSAIPVKACGYDEFLKIGFALHSLDWERSDGTSIGFDIWDEWCKQSEHYNLAGLEEKWRSFSRSARGEITVATIYHIARAAGWNGGVPDPSPQPYSNGHANGVHALPAAFSAPFGGQQPIIFPDVTENGAPKATFTNAVVAVASLGVRCQHDLFHNRMKVGGEIIAAWKDEVEISDNIVHVLRSLIRHRFGFDPNKVNTADACLLLCLKNQYDPVLDYLEEAQGKWDGKPRLDTWLSTYMGAPDTELNRHFAKLSLLAAVRRARRPGTKFDQITVLEGPEGKGKSDAIRALAGPENFSDQKILGADDRAQQELLEGVWLYEIAELTGIGKVEIEHVKAFASRTVDRTRPAYGRFRVDRPRRTIFFATTNRNDYLLSDTGNRRFWPVVTTTIDVEGIKRDRDQIWAEAAIREAKGESITLPERLWGVAAVQQDQRLARDSWLEGIEKYVNMPDKVKTDVGIMEVLVDNQFIQRRPDQVGRTEQIRAGNVLRQLGFERYHKRVGPTFCWRYKRAGAD